MLIVDADGQHPPEDALRLVSRLGEYDLVIGARSQRDAGDAGAARRQRRAQLAGQLPHRPRDPDLTSGFRGARASGLREFLHLLPNGFSTPTTTTLAFIKAGYSVTFEPIHARQRSGQSKIRLARDGAKFLMIIFKIVTLFSPLRIFVPISAASFVLGVAYGIWNVVDARAHPQRIGAADPVRGRRLPRRAGLGADLGAALRRPAVTRAPALDRRVRRSPGWRCGSRSRCSTGWTSR